MQDASITVIITTVGTEQQALDIAHQLVHRKLVACVNIVPGVRSVFRWKGKVHDDTEFLLWLKTTQDKFQVVHDAIKELHSYELPEIIGFPAAFQDASFKQWIIDSTSGPIEEDDYPEPLVGE